MHLDCRRYCCGNSQQLYHLQSWTAACFPHGRFVDLRYHPDDHRSCLPRQSSHHSHRKGTLWLSLEFILALCTNRGKIIVGVSVVYICGYNGMIAAYSWLAGGEIPSQRLRSYTFGVASAVAFAAAWLTTFTAPYFINPESLNWGPEYGQFPFPISLPCYYKSLL